jgi:hypothetical protein
VNRESDSLRTVGYSSLCPMYEANFGRLFRIKVIRCNDYKKQEINKRDFSYLERRGRLIKERKLPGCFLISIPQKFLVMFVVCGALYFKQNAHFAILKKKLDSTPS